MIRITRETGVVLDLDDTLYSERDFQFSGFRAIARQVAGDRYKYLLDRMLADAVPGGNPLSCAAAAGDFSIDQLLVLYREHEPEISLYDDARRFLQRCQAAGLRPVIVTDGRSVTQRNKIRALGLEEYIGGVIVSEEVGMGKPSLAVFLRASDMVPASRHIYIGDNPSKDFIGPKALGWATVMMRDRGRNIHSQGRIGAEEYRADEAASSFDDVAVD